MTTVHSVATASTRPPPAEYWCQQTRPCGTGVVPHSHLLSHPSHKHKSCWRFRDVPLKCLFPQMHLNLISEFDDFFFLFPSIIKAVNISFF
uniref:Uncharacterized protein n=1 Tax=Oryzias latipes TaxID=8090 RepID=A0A3P9KJ54_ORYLA